MSAGAATPATAALWLAPVLAYLFGSISFSYLIVRALKGIDIRTVGSGNAGATNVLRAAGRGPAALALLLDIGKGVAAVWVARLLDASPPVVAAVGVAAVLGHLYPVFFSFRGGKGVATAAGTLGSLAPVPTLLCLVVFAVVVAWKRYVSLGSVVVAALCPVLVVGFGVTGRLSPGWEWLALATAAIGALIVWKHRENLQRLRRGVEKRIGERVAVAAEGSDTPRGTAS